MCVQISGKNQFAKIAFFAFLLVALPQARGEETPKPEVPVPQPAAVDPVCVGQSATAPVCAVYITASAACAGNADVRLSGWFVDPWEPRAHVDFATCVKRANDYFEFCNAGVSGKQTVQAVLVHFGVCGVNSYGGAISTDGANIRVLSDKDEGTNLHN